MTRETKGPVRPKEVAGAAPKGSPENADHVRRARAAERLLTAARSYAPETRITLAEVEAMARSKQARGRQVPLRWALAGGVVLLVLSSAASVALSRGWPLRLWRAPREAPAISAPPPSTTALPKKKRRVRLALTGPAKLEVGGDDPTILVEEGRAEITSDELATPVRAGDTRVDVPPASTITLEPERPGIWRPVPGRAPVPAPTPTVDAAAAKPTPTLTPTPAGTVPVVRKPSRGTGAIASAPLSSGLADLPALRSPSLAARDEETALLHEAVQKLRAERDGAGALALLERHDARFAEGALARVAAVLRVEALLAVGKTREAWVRLEAVPADEIARSQKLRLARAELRSLNGHCPAALEDVHALASSGALEASSAELAARVIRVRNACGENSAP